MLQTNVSHHRALQNMQTFVLQYFTFPYVDSRGNILCRKQNLHNVNLMILGVA